jgi:hypothetical protein
LSELADFREVDGHCNIPKSYTENAKLATWVTHQRSQYSLHLKGETSLITPPRIQALERLGFEWGSRGIYQIPIPRYNPISPNTVLRKALTDQNAIGWGRMYSCQISQDFQTVQSVDRPPGNHDRHANAATLSDWASKLITLFFDQVEDQ